MTVYMNTYNHIRKKNFTYEENHLILITVMIKRKNHILDMSLLEKLKTYTLKSKDRVCVRARRGARRSDSNCWRT